MPETHAHNWGGPSRRRLPRYRVQAVMDVTVLRSGIPDTFPGRSLNVSENGIAAILSGELTAGESVGIEMHLPAAAAPLRARALVRHYDRLRCGMEFVALPAAQQSAIRDWAAASKAPEESAAMTHAPDEGSGGATNGTEEGPAAESKIAKSGGSPKTAARLRLPWRLLLLTMAVLSALGWWRWNRGWEELESGLASRAVEGSAHRVSADVMQKLLVHRVDPEYPAEARRERLQGVVSLDVVIAPDGSVAQVHPINGPDVLARAAAESLRWWKFEPYRVNGQPVEVETTLSVEFKAPD